MEDKKEKTKASLPMRELIAAPLIAVSEAQKQLAASTWDFYKKLAFEDDVDVNFQMEVTDALTSKSAENTDSSTDET